MHADGVAERLGHLLDAVRADEQRQRHDDLRLDALLAHQVAAEEKVEELVRPAELDVGFERDGVVALGERVEQLVEGDRLLRLPALLEVVALEDAGDRDARSQADEPAAPRAPSQRLLNAITVLSASRILNACSVYVLALSSISSRRQLRPRGFLAGRIADHPREVADDEDDPVPGVLKVPHLPEDHRVAEVDVGRRRVEADLDRHRSASDLAGEVLLIDQVDAAPPQLLERRGGVRHGGRGL